MNNKISLLIIISALISGLQAQSETVIRIIHKTGVGARAFSLGNNYVSLSNDLSAVYWNPAALAFSPVREFQVSLDVLNQNSQSEFFGTGSSDDLRRFKLTNTGLMIAVPAERGGLTFALAFNNPVAFDDISVYTGKFISGGTSYSIDNKFKTSGGLNYWSGGIGLQIASRLAAGLTATFVTGTENGNLQYTQLTNGSFDSLEFRDQNIDGKYLGYDIRGGMLYRTDLFSAGFMINFPQIVNLREEMTGIYYPGQVMEISKYKGKLYSSYSGSVGFSLTLPFVTLSTEGRYTLPFNYVFPSDDIPQTSQANYFKLGGGTGLEIPLVFIPVLLRAGYSYDELDLHTYAIRYYGDQGIDWSDGGITVDRNRHQITAGLGFAGSSASFDLSYGFSTWGLTTNRSLHQEYNLHRVMASFAMRY